MCPPLIGDLHIGDEDVQQAAALLLFQTASWFSSWPPRSRSVSMMRDRCARSCQNSRVSKSSSSSFSVAEQLAEPRIVEEQPAVLVDDQQGGRAIFEDLAQLPLVLGDLRIARCGRDGVRPPAAAAVFRRSRSPTSLVAPQCFPDLRA